MDSCSCGSRSQVDDDELHSRVASPEVGDKVRTGPVTYVLRFQQFPTFSVKFRSIDDPKDSLVHPIDVGIDNLLLHPRQLDDQLSREPFELSIIEEMHAGNGGGYYCRCQHSRFAEDRDGTPFVVILQEADGVHLEVPLRFQVQIDITHEAIS